MSSIRNGRATKENPMEEPLLNNSSINGKNNDAEPKKSKRSSKLWRKLRTSVKFTGSVKNNANIAREMEEGIRSQHLKLSPADIDKATLYILDSFEGMGMTHGVSHEDLLIHKMLYDSWFELWYIVAICLYVFEGLFTHVVLDQYMIYAIVFEIIFISTFAYDIYLHWIIETDDDEEETKRKAWEAYEELKEKERQEQQEKIDHLHDVFHSFDRDDNGTINKRELQQAFRDLGMKLSPKELAKLHSQLDLDGDGEIHFREFQQLTSKLFGTDTEKQEQSKRAFEIANNQGNRKICNIKMPELWTIYRGILVLIQVVDLLAFVISLGGSTRFSRFTRPLILVLRVQTLRVVLVGVLVAGVKIARVLFLIACDIVFFGFIGFVLFSKVEESKGFTTPFDGMRTMLLILTAPGTVLADMEPLQRHSDGWASLYFIIFVVVTTMIFQKLILANAYRSYKGYQKQQYFERLNNSKKAGTEAFKILSGGQSAITIETWRVLFADLRDGQHPMVADTIFHTCDMDYSLVPGNNALELDAFLELITLAKHTGTALKSLELHEAHELTNFEATQMKMRQWFKVKANLYFFEFEIIHTIVDLLVILSIAQLYVSISYPEDTNWVYIGIIILGCFTLEVGTKMTAFGVKQYLSYGEHILDSFCVFAGIVFFIYEKATHSEGGTLYNIALALRTLRVLKFLWLSETLHGLLWTIIRLGDSLVKLFFILFVPLYMFATVAQQIFGTTVTFHGSEAAKATKWYAVRSELNFETGINSMRTLFEITTVSSWNMVMEAADILYGNKRYTFWIELFFFSFRIIMTMMFVPVLTGFLIESFVVNFDIYEKNKNGIEEISSAKKDAYEVRRLQAGGDLIAKKRAMTSMDMNVSHPQVKHVKNLIKNQKNFDEVEKKIYGFDQIVQKALIKTLRSAVQAEKSKRILGNRIAKQTDKKTLEITDRFAELHGRHRALSKTHQELNIKHKELAETHTSVLKMMDNIGKQKGGDSVIVSSSKWQLVKNRFLHSPQRSEDLETLKKMHEKGNGDNNTDDKKKDGDNEETFINRNDLEGLITKVEESNTPPSPPPSPPS